VSALVVTGLGFVHPYGHRLEDLALALSREGRSPSQVPAASLRATPGRARLRVDGVGQLVGQAVTLALENAALLPLADPDATALVGGTQWGGLEACARFHEELLTRGPDHVTPSVFPQTAHNVALAAAAIEHQVRGPVFTLVSGVTAGLEALGWACRLLAAGRCAAVVAGGFDRWFPALGLALEAAGMVGCAEGACFFVVETEDGARARGVSPLARLHAHAIASCRRPGRGPADALARAIGRALAGHAPPVGLCSGRGGPAARDARFESAYRSVLGDTWPSLPTFAPKRSLGETFGASGPFAVAAALSRWGGGLTGPVLVDALSWGGAGAAALLVEPLGPLTRAAAVSSSMTA
jgi:3-oxoacyl-[acyl-carrier-protein] synthase II